MSDRLFFLETQLLSGYNQLFPSDDDGLVNYNPLDLEEIEETTNLDSGFALFTEAESELYNAPQSQNLETASSEIEIPQLPSASEMSIEELPPGAEDMVLSQSITVGDANRTRITINYAEGTSNEVVHALRRAAESWTSRLNDNAHLTIDFTFMASEEGNLGSAVSNETPISYEIMRAALAIDANSDADFTAVANLPEEEISLLINNTSENDGSDTPYLDDNGGSNNSTLSVNTAVAKALGLDTIARELGFNEEDIAEFFGTADADINLNSEQPWDFNPDDGIDSSKFDFVGVFAHEIGHALGILSNADILDNVANLTLADVVGDVIPEDIADELSGTLLGLFAGALNIDQFISENQYSLKTWDLFRYSPESFAAGAIDFTTGNIDEKYFSIDGGDTAVAALSSGSFTGDGFQLSHWQDTSLSGVEIGIMEPTFSPGELGQITDTDLLALEVIGWDTVAYS